MKEKITSVIKNISDIVNLIANHGVWKVIESILIIVVISLLLNPAPIITAWDKITGEIAVAEKEWRKTNDPIIRRELHDAIWELDACRASVLEFHNGKSNPSGLGFYFADMNYEIVKGERFISDQYQNINLSLLNLPDYLYENGYWYGTVDELKEIDPKLASMIKNNGTSWIAFLLLEGSVELGILEISFIEEPENKQIVGREIRHLGAIVSGKIDFANSKTKRFKIFDLF